LGVGGCRARGHGTPHGPSPPKSASDRLFLGHFLKRNFNVRSRNSVRNGLRGRLALEGEDLRKLPLHMRKTNLARLLARRPEGIFVSEFERGEIGPDLFWKACEFGLEGQVSKRRDRPYRAGRSPDWIKVKNRSHPALERVKEAFA
jgi:hypothetical protein